MSLWDRKTPNILIQLYTHVWKLFRHAAVNSLSIVRDDLWLQQQRHLSLPLFLSVSLSPPSLSPLSRLYTPPHSSYLHFRTGINLPLRALWCWRLYIRTLVGGKGGSSGSEVTTTAGHKGLQMLRQFSLPTDKLWWGWQQIRLWTSVSVWNHLTGPRTTLPVVIIPLTIG